MGEWVGLVLILVALGLVLDLPLWLLLKALRDDEAHHVSMRDTRGTHDRCPASRDEVERDVSASTSGRSK